MNIIDSFCVALGYKVDDSGLKEMQAQAQRAKAGILSMGNVITAAVTGLAVKGIAQIGSTFEQQRLQIAGYLSALGVSSDFNAGLRDAEGIIKRITIDAAKLPGEADEYVEVFKAALPMLQKALPGANLEEMAAFSNRAAAIGKTLGIDAPQIARDMNLMLGPIGRAGAQVRTFMQLMPFLRHQKGYENLDAQAFNLLPQVKRAELLKQSFEGLQPMLDASSDSFEALIGAVKSAGTMLVRLGTAGIFKGLKQALTNLNALFFDVNGNLTQTGKEVVEAMQRVSRWAVTIITYGVQIAGVFFRLAYQTGALKVALLALVPVIAGLLAMKLVEAGYAAVKMLRVLIFSVGGLKKMLLGGLLVALGLVIEDLYVFYTGGESITGLLVKKWAPAAEVIIGLLSLMAAGWVTVKVFAMMAAIKTAIGFAMMNAAAVATALKMAAAWLVAFGPLILGIASILGVIAVIYLLRYHWTAVMDWIGKRSAAAKVAIGLLMGAMVAIATVALVTGAKIAAAWLLALGPVGLVIAAIVALVAAYYFLWTRWDTISAYIKKNWLMFLPLLASPIGIFAAVMAAQVALAKNFDLVVGKMTAVWETFLDGIRAAKRWLDPLGLFPDFPEKEYQAPLPAGEGVRLPSEGPAPLAYQQSYVHPMGASGTAPIEMPGDRKYEGGANGESAADRRRREQREGFYGVKEGAADWLGTLKNAAKMVAQTPGAGGDLSTSAGAPTPAGAGKDRTVLQKTEVNIRELNVTGNDKPDEMARELDRAIIRNLKTGVAY